MLIPVLTKAILMSSCEEVNILEPDDNDTNFQQLEGGCAGEDPNTESYTKVERNTK